MFLKLVTYGATRAEALSRMEDALDNYVIRGMLTDSEQWTAQAHTHFSFCNEPKWSSLQVWPTTFPSCGKSSPTLALSPVTSAPTSCLRFTPMASRVTSWRWTHAGSCWPPQQRSTSLLSSVHRTFWATWGEDGSQLEVMVSDASAPDVCVCLCVLQGVIHPCEM